MKNCTRNAMSASNVMQLCASMYAFLVKPWAEMFQCAIGVEFAAARCRY